MTRLGQAVVCVLLIVGAWLAIRWIHATEPKAQREGATKETAMLVEVVEARPGDFHPEIVVLGTVEPERDVRIGARIAGTVIDRHPRFTPGSFVKEGQPLLQLDPTDFETAKRTRQGELDEARAQRDRARAGRDGAQADLAQLEAAVEQATAEHMQAEADLEIERGRQNVARRDYELLGERLDEAQRRLALREPQLRAALAKVEVARTRIASAQAGVLAARARIHGAEASLAAAEADVTVKQAAFDQAVKDHERTEIPAPFDGQVLTRTVDKGSEIRVGDELGRLVGTDVYWVVATVPLSKLRWIRFPDPEARGEGAQGSTVHVHHKTAWGDTRRRTGYVSRLIGALDRTTRLARVLVVVEDPLALRPDPEQPDRPPLVVGSIVEARIQATKLENVTRIDRAHLRDGQTVWTMKDGKLEIAAVEVIFEDQHGAYIASGLEPGTWVVTTDLATVAAGAPLRTEAKAPSTGGEAGSP